jgi:hypothetical protein
MVLGWVKGFEVGDLRFEVLGVRFEVFNSP